MRILIVNATGKIREMQSAASAGTLLANAVAAGFAPEDVEEREVTMAEYLSILAAIPSPPPPTASQRIDAAFPQTDAARVIFEAFFDTANRLQALEGKPSITRAQLKTWLESKLP